MSTLTNGVSAYRNIGDHNHVELVQKYTPLVRRIAQHLLARLPPSVQIDDLVQSGMIGLFEAAQQYNPERGASFDTYAGIRVRGAMLDEIRRGDWVPRSVHRESRRISQVIAELEAKLSREANDHEIAEALGVSIEHYHQQLADIRGAQLFSLDAWCDDDSSYQPPDKSGLGSPFSGLEKTELKLKLTDLISGLPERERLVLGLYYQHELNLREIGAVLDVSESRACQLHSQALLRLRARMSDWQPDT